MPLFTLAQWTSPRLDRSVVMKLLSNDGRLGTIPLTRGSIKRSFFRTLPSSIPKRQKSHPPHWLCCQSFSGLSPVETPSSSFPEFAELRPFNSFSETVAAALKAAERLSIDIQFGRQTREEKFGAAYVEGTYVKGSFNTTTPAKYTGPKGSQATKNYLTSTQGLVSNYLEKARSGKKVLSIWRT